MSALTPGLTDLLDRELARNDREKMLQSIGAPPRLSRETEGQLSLFDVSEDGSTLVSYDGETL